MPSDSGGDLGWLPAAVDVVNLCAIQDVSTYTRFPDMSDVLACVMYLNASSAPGALFLSGCSVVANPLYALLIS
eukprot:m.76977 g.76977  ORF g.76977 m.76977 type:complete len:74 (+) comp19069_c0_seq1:676-897(+)